MKSYLNIVIFSAIIAAIVINLSTSNSLAAKRFAVERKRSVVRQLSSDVALREAALIGGEDFNALVLLAQRLGMVFGKDGETLYVPAGVALSHGQASAQ